jgi:hypothetical protein
MTGRARLLRLEAYLRRQDPPPRAHFTSVVRVPADVAHCDWEAWLLSQPCACGMPYCEQCRVGVLLPEKCESPEAWEARYGPRGEDRP